jgi:cytosine deaminase
MVETFVQAVRILHLDHPIGDWALAATATPASIMGLRAGALEKGAAADMIVFKARNWSEFLSRHQSERAVIRAGKAIDTTAPDFAELDGLMAGA